MGPEVRPWSILFWPGRNRVYWQPKGVVLIISPWNYPLPAYRRRTGCRIGRRQSRHRQTVGSDADDCHGPQAALGGGPGP